jgi:hypothetical protein
MSTTLVGLLACFLYLVLAGWQWRDWRLAVPTPSGVQRLLYLLVLLAALGLHGWSVYALIDTPAGFNFSFFHVSSLIFWVICVAVLLSCIHLPLHMLLPPLFALTTIGVLCSIAVESPYTPHTLSYPVAPAYFAIYPRLQHSHHCHHASARLSVTKSPIEDTAIANRHGATASAANHGVSVISDVMGGVPCC